MTNQQDIVRCAKTAFTNYRTIVNALKESGIFYNNTLEDYAKMDNNLSKSRLGIGWSSNLAQLALSYYYTNISNGLSEDTDQDTKQLYNVFIILSVLAQVIIDSTKREFEVDANAEIVRLQNLSCMQYVRYITDDDGNVRKYKYDFPKFMKHTRPVQHIKDGDVISYDVVKKNINKMKNRINPDFVCPMNWLVECLNAIKPTIYDKTLPTTDFFVKVEDNFNTDHITKVRMLIKEYIEAISDISDDKELSSFDSYTKISSKMEKLLDGIRGIKMGRATVNKIVELSILNDNELERTELKDANKRYSRKFLNCMYRTNNRYFMESFVKGKDSEYVYKEGT